MVNVYSYAQGAFNASSIANPVDLQVKIIALNLASATYQYLRFNPNGTGFTVAIYFNQALSTPDRNVLTSMIGAYTYNLCDNSYALVQHSVASGTSGGSATNGSWVTRPLNTIQGTQGFCSLSNNRITLLKGCYHIKITAVAYGVREHQIRLRDITNSATVGLSNNGLSETTNDTVHLTQFLNLANTTTYELQHQVTVPCGEIGFGKANGFGENEVYATIWIVPQVPMI